MPTAFLNSETVESNEDLRYQKCDWIQLKLRLQI